MRVDAEHINTCYPIHKIRRYPGGWQIERKSLLKDAQETLTGRPENGKAKVAKRSNRSLGRLAWVVANSHIIFSSLLTLTYPRVFPSRGQWVKGDLNKFLLYSRRSWGFYDYLWFLEFQPARGAPHIHLLTTLQAPSAADRSIFGLMWAKIALPVNVSFSYLSNKSVFHVRQSTVAERHSTEGHWQGVEKSDGAKRYALKYALKSEQIEVPENFKNVGRFWGHSAAVKPVGGETFDCDQDDFREFLLEIGNPCGTWDVIPKYVLDRRQEK